jgi:hypothetical protein
VGIGPDCVGERQAESLGFKTNLDPEQFYISVCVCLPSPLIKSKLCYTKNTSPHVKLFVVRASHLINREIKVPHPGCSSQKCLIYPGGPRPYLEP